MDAEIALTYVIHEHPSIQHHIVFPVPQPLPSHPLPQESGSQSQSHLILCRLPSQKKNQLYVEWLFLPNIWSKCGSWPRVHFLSYFVCPLSFLTFIYPRKVLKKPKHFCLSHLSANIFTTSFIILLYFFFSISISTLLIKLATSPVLIKSYRILFII